MNSKSRWISKDIKLSKARIQAMFEKAGAAVFYRRDAALKNVQVIPWDGVTPLEQVWDDKIVFVLPAVDETLEALMVAYWKGDYLPVGRTDRMLAIYDRVVVCKGLIALQK